MNNKSNKTISLDNSIIQKLSKINNASRLINGLLEDYFNNQHPASEKEIYRKLQEKSAEANKITHEAKMLQEQLIEIKEKNKKIRELIPVGIADELRQFPKITSHVLQARFNEHYRDNYDFTFSELKEAWALIKS